MSTITVCERFLSASVEDCNLQPILYRFIAENGSMYAAIDDNSAILKRYHGIKGAGAGRIKFWLKTMLQLALFERYAITSPKTAVDLELFVQVCDATKEKQLLCYRDTDYAPLLTMYPNVKTISRGAVRAGGKALQMGTQKTVILFLAAEPTDAGRIRVGEEHREIDLRLRLAKLGNKFQLEEMFAVRPEDLTDALLKYNPTIVHFAGHGTAEGAICLEDRNGKTLPVSDTALAAVFATKALRGCIRGVVLNACYAKGQAEAIAEYVEHVVGIHRSISDKAAIAYSLGLYQGIAAGKSFSESHEVGCVQIGLHGIRTESQPELITSRHSAGRT